MTSDPKRVSLRISAGKATAPSPGLTKVLARVVKRTPEEIQKTLETGSSILLNGVPVTDEVRKFVAKLKRAGLTVERVSRRTTSAAEKPKARDVPGQTTAGEKGTQRGEDAGWKKGDVIEGLYEVLGSAAGGMGRVYFVRHRLWKMMLAIKTPLPEAVKGETSLLRFLREAELWVDIGLHPNIATCYYARVIKGLPRLFIEFVDGGNLDDLVERRKINDLAKITDLMLQFCHGMMHAEDRGMIHRDIKPANCLLTRDGQLKITDFGLVKRVDEPAADSSDDDATAVIPRITDANLTVAEGVIMGSPWFMAPERFRQKVRDDIRSDIYSFGVMLYMLVLGRPPFKFPDGFSIKALARSHIKETPIDPLSIRPDLPKGLVDVIMTCLEKKPENRYPSFVDACRALETIYRRLKPDREPRPRPNVVGLKADSLNNQAVSLLDLGREEEAEKLLEDAHSGNTEHLEAVYNLHAIRWAKGELSDLEAINRLESLKIEVRETPVFRHLMGLICLQRGDPETGVPLLKEACSLGSHFEERWRDYGGDPEAFVRSLELKPIREEGTLAGHLKAVRALAFSEDGSLLFSAGEDRSIRKWDVETHRCVKNLRTFTFVPVAGSFSRDGELAATCYGSAFKTIDLWDMKKGRPMGKVQGAAAFSLAFSADGKLLAAGGQGGHLRIIDAKTAKIEWETDAFQEEIRTLCFIDEDNTLLVGGDQGGVSFFRPGIHEPVFSFKAHEGAVLCAAVSRDGAKLATGGGDDFLRLWDLVSKKEIGVLTGHRGKVVDAGFTPDGGYVVSASSDGTLKIWDTAIGRCYRTIDSDGKELVACAVSPDGERLVAGSTGGGLRLWTLDTGWFSRNFLEPAICRPRTFEELSELHASFKSAVAGFHDAWQQGDFPEAVACFKRAAAVPGFSWSEETIGIRNILSEALRYDELVSHTFIRSMEGHDGPVVSLDVSTDSLRLLSGGLDGGVAVWDVVSGRCLKRIELGSGVGSAMFLPRDAGFVTWSEDMSLRLWNEEGEPVAQMSGVSLPVALARDGKRLLAFSEDGRVISLDLAGLNILAEGPRIPAGDPLCFSWDGSCLFSLLEGTRIQRWDWKDARSQGAFRDLGVEVSALASVEGDQNIIAGMETGELNIYVVGSGVNVATLRGHSEAVTSLVQGPKPNLWLSGSEDCSVRLWDIAEKKCMVLLEGHSSPVRTVRFFPNGFMVASAGSDGSVRLWGLDWEVPAFLH